MLVIQVVQEGWEDTSFSQAVPPAKHLAHEERWIAQEESSTHLD